MEETKMDRFKGHLRRNKNIYLIGTLVGASSVALPTVVVKMVKEAYEQGKSDTLKALSVTITESFSDGYNTAYEELTSTSATDEMLDVVKSSFQKLMEDDPDSILNT